jgi:hypothetical protein
MRRSSAVCYEVMEHHRRAGAANGIGDCVDFGMYIPVLLWWLQRIRRTSEAIIPIFWDNCFRSRIFFIGLYATGD